MNHYSRTGQAAELHLFRRILCALLSDGVFGAFGSGDGLDFIRMGQQQTKRGYEWSENGWTFVALEPASPQTNSWDCGIFVLTFVKAMVLGIDFDVTESDMPRIRHIINWELQYSALKPFLVGEYSPAGRFTTEPLSDAQTVLFCRRTPLDLCWPIV
ncbi:hypothetical protein GQ42DRAFT_155544 [Ramicandelaber brevisporus]|nr:hypothetical protein GQ42DRAFT_155544 [Ramicandelaber brevisporus]